MNGSRPEQAATSGRRRRRRPQFTIRAILLLLLAAALLCGAYTWLAPYRRQHGAIATLRELGAEVRGYDTIPPWLALVQRIDPIGEERFFEADHVDLFRRRFHPDDLKHILNLRRLTSLTLRGSEFRPQHLHALSRLSHLRRLTLDSTSVTREDVKQLKQALPSFVEVRLTNRFDAAELMLRGVSVNGLPYRSRASLPVDDDAVLQLADRVEAAKISRITSLSLRHATREDLQWLLQRTPYCPLTRLELRASDLTASDAQRLAGLPGLSVLNLAEPRQLQGRDLAFLRSLGGLEELDLRGMRLDETGLAYVGQLKMLKRLCLAHCDLSGAETSPLAGLQHLELLDLSRNPLSDGGLKFLEGLTELRVLSLQSTQVTGEGLRHLAHLPKLTEVDLYDTPLTDVGAQHLGNVASLKRLVLRRTNITDRAAAHLCRLKNIQWLNLSETAVSAPAADTIDAQFPYQPVAR